MSISRELANSYFTTYDLNLCCVLVSLGFKLDSLDRTNPQKVQFVFERTDQLDETIQTFWAKQLRIEPQLLLSNLKLLKNRLYSGE